MYFKTDFNTQNSKNARFLDGMNYLIRFLFVKNQKEFAKSIGVTEATISGIIKNRKIVSDKTIRKMLDAFPYIFNHDYFFGKDIPMSRKNVKGYEEEQEQANKIAEPLPEYHAVPAWADSLIQLVATQTKTIEDLRREVTSLREEINQLKK